MRSDHSLLRERSGVALPLALLAMIATALLLSALLVSAATEVAISSAQQDAARDLYRLEAAVEAQVEAGGAALLPGEHAAVFDPEVRITVRQLAWTPVPDQPDLWRRTLSLTAQRSSGGRRLSAMVQVAAAAPDSEPEAAAGGEAVMRTFAWSEVIR